MIGAQSGQIAALAQDVLDLADVLGMERFAVVGQDWGSRAAEAVAVLAPERVTQLVALATGYGPGLGDPELQLRQTHAFWYQWTNEISTIPALPECRWMWHGIEGADRLTYMNKLELRLITLFRDFETNLGADPLAFVFSKIEIVVGNKPNDFFVRDDFY